MYAPQRRIILPQDYIGPDDPIAFLTDDDGETFALVIPIPTTHSLADQFRVAVDLLLERAADRILAEIMEEPPADAFEEILPKLREWAKKHIGPMLLVDGDIIRHAQGATKRDAAIRRTAGAEVDRS